MERRTEEYKKFSKTDENQRLLENKEVSLSDINICPKCGDCETTVHNGKLNMCVNCRFGINGHKKMAKPKPKV